MTENKGRMSSRGRTSQGGIVAVARAANVSSATVSRILSGEKSAFPYSEATRKRVKKAAESLRYMPNIHARSLVRGRADHVALIVRPLWAPFYGELADQFVRAFSEFNLRVSIDEANVTEEATVSSVRNFGGEMVDAIFVCPSHPSMSFERIREATRSPVICLGYKPADPRLPHVAFDLREAAREATRHLVRLGRRRIGYVGMVVEADGRFEGYRDALREAGMTSDPSLQICDHTFLLERGQEAGETLASLERPPDALFVASDLLAMGVIRGLGRKGVRMPEDVAMVSIDGIKIGAYSRPSLTTMAMPLPLVANHCLTMVQAIHSGKTMEEIMRMSVSLRAGLVVRESCGQKAPSPGARGSVDTWRAASAPVPLASA